MTTTIQDIFSKLPQIIEKEAVCNGCRDKSRCEICEFNKTEKVSDPILTIEGKELVLIPPKQKKRKKSA